jgi:hypothetical protein
MVIFYKNYKRTERTLLCIKSVRHLFPTIQIKCLFLYNYSESEYENDIIEFKKLNVELFFDKKRNNFDDGAPGGTPGGLMGFYFTEGINKIQSLMKDYDGKVLILDEDNFFTTGETINFLLNTDFDLAYGTWPAPFPVSVRYKIQHHHGMNASILAMNPKKLNHIFPLIEMEEYIENILGYELWDKCVQAKYKMVHIPTRNYGNYHGDGVFTNDIEVIKKELKKANIPYE